MNEQGSDDALDRATKGLPRSIQPRRDLWPGIEQRLSRPKAAPRVPRLVWGPAVLLAASILMLVTIGRLASPGVGPAALSRDTIQRLEAECDRADADVRGLLVGNSAVSEATRDVLTANLSVIDGAIRETEAALGRYPNDVTLANRLTAGYEEKLSLLRTARAVVSIAGRTDT